MRSTVKARVARALSLVLVVAGVLTFVASGTGQAVVPPLVDYGAYPSGLPTSCTVSGADFLVGEQFTTGGVTVSDLRTLPVQPGDTISMTWTGFAPGCEGVGVGFSSKVATVPSFDSSRDFWLHEYTYCGPETGATPCTAPYQITVQVPSAAVVPCYQLDAHIGPPLAVVGPSGAFYGVLNGTRNVLVSALNGGSGDCSNPPPCATNPSLPAAAYLCGQQATTTTAPTTTEPPTTSTSAPAVTTTTAPTTTAPTTTAPTTTAPTTTAPTTTAPTTTAPTTTAPTTTAPSTSTSAQAVTSTTVATSRCALDPTLGADAPECVPCATNPALLASSPNCVRVAGTSLATAPALPRTGRDTRALMSTGALFLLAGLCLAYAYRPSSSRLPV